MLINFNFLKNIAVVNANNEHGIISDVDDRIIYVSINNDKNNIKEYAISAFDKGFLRFIEKVDENLYLEQVKKEQDRINQIFYFENHQNTYFEEAQKKRVQQELKELELFLKERNIVQLVHFSNKKNHDSILKYGLLPRSVLDAKGIKYFYNDEKRIDFYCDAICLSITKENVCLKNEYKRNKNEFEVWYIDPKILLKSSVKRIYCQTNAANSNGKKGRTIEDFKSMFDDVVTYNVVSKDSVRTIMRKDYNRKINETTDEQAEILFFNQIPSEYISLRPKKE